MNPVYQGTGTGDQTVLTQLLTQLLHNYCTITCTDVKSQVLPQTSAYAVDYLTVIITLYILIVMISNSDLRLNPTLGTGIAWVFKRECTKFK